MEVRAFPDSGRKSVTQIGHFDGSGIGVEN
jgi:hypothetical protein